MTESRIILYRSGYKYQLHTEAAVHSDIELDESIHTPFFDIIANGLIIAKIGYAWNGANWPAIDTKTIMRASLFHDIVCQAVSEGMIDHKWRIAGDELFHRLCLEDGMWKLRAKWCFRAVKRWGEINRKVVPPKIKHAP